MKLGKAYERGSRLKIVHFFRFDGVIRFSLGTLDNYNKSEKLQLLRNRNILSYNEQRPIRTDTVNCMDMYRIYIVYLMFLLHIRTRVVYSRASFAVVVFDFPVFIYYMSVL
jgi:hypothetical protein